MMYAQALAKQPQVIPGRDPMLDIKEELERLRHSNYLEAQQKEAERLEREMQVRAYIARCNDKIGGTMHAVLGGVANLTETYMVDFLSRLEKNKKLYRHKVKHEANIARNAMRRLIHAFYTYRGAANTATLWCDLTDIMEDELRSELTKLRLSVLQAYRHQNVEDEILFTDALMAANFAFMLDSFRRDFHTLCYKRFHMEINPKFTHCIAEPIKTIKDSLYKINYALGLEKVEFSSEECRTMNNGFRIIEKHFNSYDWVELMCHKSLELNGIINDENEENDTSNNYTPWNEAQKGVVIHYYYQDGAEGVARMLHRSVGAVRRMYYRLKKTGKYENL